MPKLGIGKTKKLPGDTQIINVQTKPGTLDFKVTGNTTETRIEMDR
jgi:hypothetical protein